MITNNYSYSKSGNLVSIIERILIIIITGLLLTSCSSGNALRKKVVNTGKKISPGLQIGKKIYFLCDYVLSEPGTTVIPMYLHKSGTVYFDKVFLYSFDIPKEKLTQVANLKPTSSYSGRGTVEFAKWAYAGSKIYILYSTGWEKKTNKKINDVFCYNSKTSKTDELINNDKITILNKYFSSGKNRDTISMSQVMYYAGCTPDEKWLLPSPVEFSKISTGKIDRVIIEAAGDLAFEDAVFQVIRKSITQKDAERITDSMKKWNEELPGDKQMIYTPYMEKWSAKLSAAAKINARRSRKDKQFSGSTEFLLAAFTDNTQKLTEFLNTEDINTADKNGCTALMYSIFGRAPHTMELLMKSGADLKQESNSGYNAWMFVSNTPLRQRYLKLKH